MSSDNEVNLELWVAVDLPDSKHKYTSAQIFPTIEIVSTGYNPRRVSAPRRIASLPEKL